ncbi:hypothetical protein [Streptomyces pseudogriseolus]|uniref:hypothetical protein n=1 Tax=Streptomyces pseudogriseolus TaxID=36817 RepID=UPI00324E4A3B
MQWFEQSLARARREVDRAESIDVGDPDFPRWQVAALAGRMTRAVESLASDAERLLSETARLQEAKTRLEAELLEAQIERATRPDAVEAAA